ncbi:hypothetical protein V5O48_008945 [Marasmius crinis-equi]|uniref:Uncharacterized protein n=1 Tax=Marasmius crinis-equi TaxID=585013 RepID=A0ABR3FCJ3_9AGAR
MQTNSSSLSPPLSTQSKATSPPRRAPVLPLTTPIARDRKCSACAPDSINEQELLSEPHTPKQTADGCFPGDPQFRNTSALLDSPQGAPERTKAHAAKTTKPGLESVLRTTEPESTPEQGDSRLANFDRVKYRERFEKYEKEASLADRDSLQETTILKPPIELWHEMEDRNNGGREES